MQYTIKWPLDFDNFSWELESKGWFAGIEIIVEDKILRPTFYDPVRLAQDISAEISRSHLFIESHIIVIPQVTPDAMASAIGELARTGELKRLM